MAPPWKVLATLDATKVQYYHFKAIIIAGMGLFTDAYDFFCIAPIMQLIGYVYYDDDDDNHNNVNISVDSIFSDKVPAVVTSFLVAIALLGTVIGQLLFGRLGDLVGRRKVYGLALMIMVFSSLGCGFSAGRCRSCVLLSLGLFRFSLGIGIGGDYPLSATIMSEFANRWTRGAFIAAVFSMQGFGILVGSIVTMVTCAIFNRASGDPVMPAPEVVDFSWRLILMIGAIPAGLTCYWRMMMPETARYTALVKKNVVLATKDMEKVLNVPLSTIAEGDDEGAEDDQDPDPNPNPTTPSPISNRMTNYLINYSSTPSYPLFSKEFLHRHGRDLFSCAVTWFLVDVVFYSNNLLQSHIYKRCLNSGDKKLNAYDAAFRVARLQAIIAICSTIPGYFATVYLIDRIGRVAIQTTGFFFMAVWLFAIGIPYHSYWKGSSCTAGFMALYGLIFFSSNFGPNTTTFIVPAELFPARFRSTCHGIAGAAGKVGAIIGSVGFLWASHGHAGNGYGRGIGMTASLVILGVVSLVGGLTTYLFTMETMGRSLEDNEINVGSNEEDSGDGGCGWCFVRSLSSINGGGFRAFLPATLLSCCGSKTNNEVAADA